MFIKKIIDKNKSSLIIKNINRQNNNSKHYNNLDANYIAKLIMMNNKEFDRTKLPVIELTPLESKIVELIKLYINTHNNEYKQDPIVCRIAGGWVRDKLLNIPSNDIDISIENKTISGEAFLNNLIGFYKSNEMRLADYNEKVNSTYTLDDIFPKNVHTTKVNPDKSKHLETAIATIFDQSIDFVALRKEVYDDSLNNRIPFIELGTPLDDALRRDCTLNSLFYNINEGILEDFTGKGVSDLFEGIIRTPLSPPLRTFMDDPLRIFRLLRFKNKYGFKFADNLVSCFIEDNQLLQNHIVRKISRERIALEVNKILSYNDLLILTNFLKDVLQFNLSRFLYSNNNETYTDNDLKKKIVQSKKTMQVDDIKVHESTLKWLIECLPLELESFLANPFLMGLGQTIEKTILMHTVLLLPLYASGMSFSVKDVDFLLISNNIPKQTIRKILQIQSVLIKEDLDFEDMSRAELGNFIKEMTEIANFTNYITILNLLQPEKYKMLIAKLKLHKFDSYALDQLWSPTTFKPLLNGNEIKQRLNKKPGKWLKDVMDMQWNYIFNNQLDLETDSDKSANEAKNKNQFFVWLETSSVKF